MFEEMDTAQLIERRAAIVADIEAPNADLDALMAEASGIYEELQTRKANEAKKAEIRKAVATGSEVTTTIKEFKENEKMEERTFAVDSVEYRDAYLKNLMGKPLEVEERAALTKAASVIPTETVNAIYGKLEENPLIGKLNALHIPGYVSVPCATTVADASWVAIGTASTDSADVIDSVALTAKKLIKTIEITADIQAMSVPAFQSWLTSKLAAKMERAICAAVISGAGSTTVPTGIEKGRTASSVAKTVAGLGALMAGVGTAYHSGACWIMNAKTFYTDILPLANDNNGLVVNDGIGQRLLGHEVVFEDAVADDEMIFGNLGEGYVFNYGEGIAIEADQSVAFRSGSTVYRAMALCDGAVVDADAFAYGKFSA